MARIDAGLHRRTRDVGFGLSAGCGGGNRAGQWRADGGNAGGREATRGRGPRDQGAGGEISSQSSSAQPARIARRCCCCRRAYCANRPESILLGFVDIDGNKRSIAMRNSSDAPGKTRRRSTRSPEEPGENRLPRRDLQPRPAVEVNRDNTPKSVCVNRFGINALSHRASIQASGHRYHPCE